MRLAVGMLVKALLQYVDVVADDRDFGALWEAALTALQVRPAAALFPCC